MPDVRAGEHVVRRVRDLVRADVLAGRHPRHLPDEPTLMVRYDCSRTVMRAALTLLAQEGLLERTRGAGTFVLARKVLALLDEAHGAAAPGANSLWAGQMAVRVLDRSVIPVPSTAAAVLDEPVGSDCLRVDYVALVDGEPAAVATNYVAMPEGQTLRDAPFRTDWYAFLSAGGVEMGRSEFVIEAAVADELDAHLLDVREGSPLILLQQVIRDTAGRAYDLAFIRLTGGRWSFFSSVPRVTRGARAGGGPGTTGTQSMGDQPTGDQPRIAG